MSKVCAENFNQGQLFDITDNNDFENDDLVEFQHFYYSQLTKYSKHIRDSYLFSDVTNKFPQEIRDFQEECQLSPESVDYFFQLLNKNFNIDEDLILTYIQCIDLLKISKHLQVRKLFFNINQYIKSHNIDVDFAIQMVEYEIKTRKETNNYDIEISNEVESSLIDKINECFTNEKFKNLPIQIIYRIIKKCSPDSIDSDKLFDIIVSSLSKFCVLFPFLDLQKLSDDRLDDLCRMYSKSNENTQHYYDYLKCNLNLINEMNDRKKNLEKMSVEQQNKLQGQLNEQQDKVKDLESKIELLQNRFNDSEKANSKLQSQLDDSKEKNDEQQNKVKDLESKIELLQNRFNDSEKANSKLQSQLDDSKEKNSEQQDKVKDLESKIELLQNRFNDSEKANNKLQSQLDDSKEKNDDQQNKVKDLESKIEFLQNQVNDSNNVNNEQLNKMKDLEKLITQLQNKLEDSVKEHKKQSLFEGQIVASVEKGILINVEINLKTECGTLDTSKSKVIVSTSDVKCLGCEAYEKGEPITSLHMKTTFACASGTYYVRCIAFNSDGESNEIVSNPVTTTLSSFTFEYDEQNKPAIISLPRGQYKLEVWGAKGGDSTGNCFSDYCYGNRSSNQTVKGGLGGYSRGILSLTKNETVYVYVGEEGKPSNSSDGSTTKGGFPDGGGTKTGHYDKYTTVPGTGGGSTSIRIGSDTDYNRVIVAGGGGGASGSCTNVYPGGFGGGLNGGNCSFNQSLQNQGSGTQTGSTEGLGEGSNGDKGLLGKGATGKYGQGHDSGGGGGGGWYGGGSGGYGCSTYVSSGGGGSGWTFTKSSMEVWEKGDPSNASNFALDGQYYLKDAACIAGDQEFPRKDGNGNERGHSGNGFAKITPI